METNEVKKVSLDDFEIKETIGTGKNIVPKILLNS